MPTIDSIRKSCLLPPPGITEPFRITPAAWPVPQKDRAAEGRPDLWRDMMDRWLPAPFPSYPSWTRFHDREKTS